MAELTANQFSIKTGAVAGGKQQMISFDGLLVDNTTKKITLNNTAVTGGDVEVKKLTSGIALLVDVSAGAVGINGAPTGLAELEVFGNSFLSTPTAVTAAAIGIMEVNADSSGTITDGFGSTLSFTNTDTAQTRKTVGNINVTKLGSGGRMSFGVGVNGGTFHLVTDVDGVGIGQDPSTAGVLSIGGNIYCNPADAGTTNVLTGIEVSHETSGNMADGFGANILFTVTDATATRKSLANLSVIRDGGDGEGKLVYRGGTNGGEIFLTIAANGKTQLNEVGLASGDFEWLKTGAAQGVLFDATNGEIFLNLPGSAGTTGSLWSDSGTVKVAA